MDSSVNVVIFIILLGVAIGWYSLVKALTKVGDEKSDNKVEWLVNQIVSLVSINSRVPKVSLWRFYPAWTIALRTADTLVLLGTFHVILTLYPIYHPERAMFTKTNRWLRILTLWRCTTISHIWVFDVYTSLLMVQSWCINCTNVW